MSIELINKINNPLLSIDEKCEWFCIVKNISNNECKTWRNENGVKLKRAAMQSDGNIANLIGLDLIEDSEECLEKSIKVVDAFYKFTKENNIKTGFRETGAFEEIINKFNWVDDLPIL